MIGSILADKNVTEELTSKEKRQTDHETRTAPQAVNRRQQQGGYFQDPEAAAHYFAQQSGGQLLFRPHQHKAGQEQVQEVSFEPGAINTDNIDISFEQIMV